MSNFFNTTIGEQLTLQRGFDITKKQQIAGDVPVVSSGGVASYHNEAKVEGPGVVLGRKGTLGTVFYIEEDYWPHDTSLWVKDFKGNNPRFVYYFFKSITAVIKKMDVGAANPALNRNHVHPMEVKWPVRKAQNYIVEVLAKLDNKIELNRQTNQTLEAIAQAIFKSWFVDFDPTRAKIAANECAQARAAGASTEELIAQLLEDGRWTKNQAQTIAQGDPELAAMSAISGQFVSAVASKGDETHEQDPELTPGKLKELRETAALFPSVLVDSELGEIPEGWGVMEIGAILEFNPKRTLKKGVAAPYLDMKNVPTQGHLADDVYLREMASGTKFINGDTLLARITPCLENGKTAYVDFLEDGQVAWGSTEYIVMRPKNGRPMSLGYIVARLDSFRSKAIQTMTGTSGRQRANAKALSEQLWIDYPLELLDVFDRIAGGYLSKAKENGEESKILSELRDTLLPKLLSGEIDLEMKPEAPK